MATVFIDVDSQLDFLYPAGALYVPGAERIVPAIARLNRYAAANGIPVISTTDAHTENDPEFKTWPHHCVAGTTGQRKAEAGAGEKRGGLRDRHAFILARQHASLRPGGEAHAAFLQIVHLRQLVQDALARF